MKGYREAWHLLREAAEVEEFAEVEEKPAEVEAPHFPRNAVERIEYAFNFFRRQLERGSAGPEK